MKYLIKNRVINADHIIKAVYFEAGMLDDDLSHCGIVTSDNKDGGWNEWLNGTDADRFWEAYMSDAYTVVNP